MKWIFYIWFIDRASYEKEMGVFCVGRVLVVLIIFWIEFFFNEGTSNINFDGINCHWIHMIEKLFIFFIWVKLLDIFETFEYFFWTLEWGSLFLHLFFSIYKSIHFVCNILWINDGFQEFMFFSIHCTFFNNNWTIQRRWVFDKKTSTWFLNCSTNFILFIPYYQIFSRKKMRSIFKKYWQYFCDNDWNFHVVPSGKINGFITRSLNWIFF